MSQYSDDSQIAKESYSECINHIDRRNNIRLEKVAIHDYQSGKEIGREEINMASYMIWAQGPSEVCAAFRCLSRKQIQRLGIQDDTTIFCFPV